MSSLLTKIKRLWPARIRGQLILGIALIHLVLMSAFVFDMVNRQRDFLKTQNREQAFSFVTGYAVNSSRYVIANDFDELQRLTLSHTNYPNLKYAMVLSPEGVVMAHINIKLVGKKLVDKVSLKLQSADSTTTLVENDNLLDRLFPFLQKLKWWDGRELA